MTLQQKLVQADDYLDMLKDKAKETDELAKENLQLRKKFDRAINELRKSDRKIERLKIDYQQANDIIVEQSKEIERLNKENELLKSNPNFVYAMRNNKAIDIIKNYLCSYDYTSAEFKEIAEVFMNLLNTLKGADKE